MPNPIPEQMMNIVHRGSHDFATRRLLGVGRLADQKQFNVLIRVFASLANRHSLWSLRILGEGPLRADLQRQIAELGLESRIKLAGVTSAIENEFVEADIFALTSKYEGFGMVLVEAMTVGLPCVTFDCPSGPREISMDGQVALLVTLNDEQALELALERLMVDADLRKTLGSQARASVIERFSLAKIIEQWDLLFQELGIQR
jgi:glycosyltransferase involved in cell wall biosynthesis